jgi:hypothetical protein
MKLGLAAISAGEKSITCGAVMNRHHSIYWTFAHKITFINIAFISVPK